MCNSYNTFEATHFRLILSKQILSNVLACITVHEVVVDIALVTEEMFRDTFIKA